MISAGKVVFFTTFSICVLLLFYICCVYPNCSKIEKHSLIQRIHRTPHNISGRFPACRFESDCLTDRVCHLGVCVPKFVKGEDCNPNTGIWTPIHHQGNIRIACVCLYPELATQKVLGGNCDRDVTCGVGHLKQKPFKGPYTAECECPPGYVFQRNMSNGRPSCQAEKTFERIIREEKEKKNSSCSEGEVDIRFSNSYFKPELYEKISPIRCVKRPCSYDALSGRPLKRTRFETGWGCICDPRKGNLGVRLHDTPENRFLADDIPGYNACVNIFEEGELEQNTLDVTLYSYFYVYDKYPISFVQWSHLDVKSLAEPFRQMTTTTNNNNINNNFTFQLEEIWPYNYAQFILRNPDAFLVQIPVDTCRELDRYAVNITSKRYFFCGKYIVTHYVMPECRNLPFNRKHTRFAKLLKYPICYIHKHDGEGKDIYDGWVVTNPLYVTERSKLLTNLPKEHDPTRFTNGMELKPHPENEDVWQVFPAPFDPSLIAENAFEYAVPRWHDS